MGEKELREPRELKEVGNSGGRAAQAIERIGKNNQYERQLEIFS